MKIVITGATGFVGSHVVRRLGPAHELVVLARQRELPAAMQPLVHRHLPVDLVAPDLPAIQADVCIHIAGLATDQASYAELYAANVEATARVFEAVQCPLFVYISSGSVYDDTRTPFRETDAIFPERLTAYGKTKWLGEEALIRLNLRDQRKVVMLRPRAVYGPGDRVLLPRMLNLGRKGVFTVPGTLRTRMSMMHVENLVSAIVHVIDVYAANNQSVTEVFNVADSQEYRLDEVLTALYAGVFGGAWRVRPLPVAPLMGLAKGLETLGVRSRLTPQAIRYLTRHTLMDTARIRQTLGWDAPHTFYDSLPVLTDWVHRVGVEQVKAADALLPWR